MQSIERAKSIFQKILPDNPPNLISLLIWLIGLVILTCLTIGDVYPILTDYYDDETNVAVKITVIRNGSIRYPPLHLCIPYDLGQQQRDLIKATIFRKNDSLFCPLGCDKFNELISLGWDVWNQMNQTPFDPHSSWNPVDEYPDKSRLTTLGINKILKDLPASVSLAIRNQTFHEIMIDYALIFLNFFTTLDTDFFAGDMANISAHLTSLNWNQGIHEKKGDVDVLFNSVLSYFCNFLTISQLSHINSSMEIQNIQNICSNQGLKSTYSSTEGFCLILPSDLGHFQTHVNAKYLTYAYPVKHFLLYPESPLLTDISPLFTSSWFGSKNGDYRKEMCQIQYNVQSNLIEQRTGKHCFPDATRADCINRCKTEKIIQTCSCIPFTSRWLTNRNDLPYCNGTKYTTCMNQEIFNYDQCNDKCLTACQYTSYQWQITSKIIDNSELEFDLEVKPLQIPHIEFISSTKDTTKNLISEIGGSVGFYLGLNALSVIIFMIYLLERGRKWRVEKKGKKQAELLPFWQWMRLTNRVAMDKYQKQQQDGEMVLESKNVSQSDVEFLKRQMDELRKNMEQKDVEYMTKMEKRDQEYMELRNLVNGKKETIFNVV